MKVKISELYVRYNHKYINIYNHPYYLSLLNNDENLYNSSLTSSYQKNKKTGVFNEYRSLMQKIAKKFNKHKNPIKIVNNICRHGRHRICILFYLYKDNFILIKNNKVTSIV